MLNITNGLVEIGNTLIKSIRFLDESVSYSIGDSVEGFLGAKIYFIYDYREEPEKAFWIYLDSGDQFFVNEGKVIVEYYEGGEYID
ncbi:hypothetical protein [Bacillus pumilus]|uniref:Uncharacterized protein n=2 Tax=Bacillus pumilus TaxID=1408 RepID=A0AAD0MM49_BACPU|nr:hypothetical protein [Bacillus pumilus]AVM24270.1 hypothetical protein C5695_10650 [Bacillus pumilus]